MMGKPMETLAHYPVLVFAVAFVSLLLASMASAFRMPTHTDGAGTSDYRQIWKSTEARMRTYLFQVRFTPKADVPRSEQHVR
jgi:hypothetical protein